MRRNDKIWTEFTESVDQLNLGGSYFVEERIARIRGRFLRAVKDVSPGEGWWEIRYFFAYESPCWAYLPEHRQTSEFAWGHTIEQAYLNGIFQQVSSQGRS